MKCPFCSYEDTKVIDSRSQEDNSVIRRRRLCEKCGKRFTTYERIDTIPLTVIKKDNTREQFDKTKLLNGIMKSCYKRPVSVHQMELLVENIENAITNSERKEIESQKIGDMVIEELKNLDEVSYVRFASVYRQFKDINTFREALEQHYKYKYPDDCQGFLFLYSIYLTNKQNSIIIADILYLSRVIKRKEVIYYER